MRRVAYLAFAAVLCAQSPPNARDIVRKSVDRDQANWRRMQNYTWIATESERLLDGHGEPKSIETKKWETLVLYGEPYRRMLERNGQPLSNEQRSKEQEKLDRKLDKLRDESPAQREHRNAKQEEEREKSREFLREIPDVYDFRLLGEAQVDGHEAWQIEATPKADYKPKSGDAKALQKIRGRLWIDKAEYQWVRLEAETTDTISFGLFIARLAPGAKLVFEQARVNNEVWLPKREWVRGEARLALVKKLGLEQELNWSNYRKFQTETKIIMDPELPRTAPPEP